MQAARHDLVVAFDGHLAGFQAKGRHQLGDIGHRLEHPLLAIDMDAHHARACDPG